MSSEASVKIKGEKHSAWYYRELYLDEDIIYDEFFCPYCDVRLIAKNIYRDRNEELIKQPYFASFPGKGHALGCEFEALEKVDQEETGGVLTGSRTNKPSADDPEIFAVRTESYWQNRAESDARRKMQQTISNEALRSVVHKGESSDRYIDGARNSASRVYSMRSFAECYALFYKKAFKLRDENKWSKEQFNEYVKKELSAKNLVFSKDNATNYYYGFKSLYKEEFLDFKRERIYHGKGYIEKSGSLYQVNSNKRILLKNGSTVPFYVLIEIVNVEHMPRSHRDIVDFMESAAKDRKNYYDIKWFARGIPAVKGSSIVLYLKNLDFLFLKK